MSAVLDVMKEDHANCAFKRIPRVAVMLTKPASGAVLRCDTPSALVDVLLLYPSFSYPINMITTGE